MNRCHEIKANVKMEECYEGMSLVFDGSRDDLKELIGNTIEKVSASTGLKPLVFDNAKTDKSSHEAFYIEFTNEVQRESGAFFELVLKELGIDHCENDTI